MFNKKQKTEITTSSDSTLIATESLRSCINIAASVDTLITMLSDQKIIDQEEFVYLRECILSTPTYQKTLSVLEAIDAKMNTDVESERDMVSALEGILQEIMKENGENQT